MKKSYTLVKSIESLDQAMIEGINVPFFFFLVKFYQ